MCLIVRFNQWVPLLPWKSLPPVHLSSWLLSLQLLTKDCTILMIIKTKYSIWNTIFTHTKTYCNAIINVISLINYYWPGITMDCGMQTVYIVFTIALFFILQYYLCWNKCFVVMTWLASALAPGLKLLIHESSEMSVEARTATASHSPCTWDWRPVLYLGQGYFDMGQGLGIEPPTFWSL